MPPFAVFAQEERPKLLHRQPHLSFVECNRVLGELWHELPEIKKKLYRIKAKKIQDSRLQVWCQLQAETGNRNVAPPVASTAGSEVRSQSIVPRQRRTHGFAVFLSEKKAEYTTPDQSRGEVTKIMAVAWRKLSKMARREYDGKAAQMNAMADLNYIEQLKRLNRLRHPPPAEPVAAPLKIASFTSMSPQTHSPAPANPALKLPSSISISRVEPEVTVVAETSPGLKSLEQLRANNQLSVTKGTRSPVQPAKLPLLQRAPDLSLRGGRPAVRGAKFVQNRRPPAAIPPASPIYPLPGRVTSASRGAPGGLKRPMRGAIQGPPPAKHFRRAFYPHQASPTEFGLPINNRNLSAHDTLCRLCGVFLSRAELVFTLSDKPAMLKMIEDCLGLTIIPEQDREVKLPNVVCNKCCSSICAFNKFKVSIVQGLAKLNRLVEIRKSRQNQQQERQSQSIEQPNHSEESILPDLNTDDLDPNSSSKLSSTINIKDEPLDREEHDSVDAPEKKSVNEESAKLGNGIIKGEKREETEGKKSTDNEPVNRNGNDPLNFFQIGEAHSIDQFDNTDDESNGASSSFAIRDHSESMNQYISEEDSQHAQTSQNDEDLGEPQSKEGESQEEEEDFDNGDEMFNEHPDDGEEHEEENNNTNNCENGEEDPDPQDNYETDVHDMDDANELDNDMETNNEDETCKEELGTGADKQPSQNENVDLHDPTDISEKIESEFKNPVAPKARAISQDTDDHSTADESQDEDNSGSSTESQSEDTSSGSDHSGNIRASTDGSTTTVDEDHELTKEIGLEAETDEGIQSQKPVEALITHQSIEDDSHKITELGENVTDVKVKKECLSEMEVKLRSFSPEEQLATAINSIQSEEFSKPRPFERNSTESLKLPEELPPEELPPPCQESESAVEAILT